MTQKNHRNGSIYARKRRIEEVAFLYFDGWDKKDIAEESGYSIRTIERDIEYIEKNKEEFLS